MTRFVASNAAASAVAARCTFKEPAERNAALARERLARATSEAHLQDAQRQVADLQARLLKAEEGFTAFREAAKRETEAAEERSAGAERRAAPEIDGERLERSRADKRAQPLERKLDALQSEPHSAHAGDVESTAKRQSEIERLQHAAATAAKERDEVRSQLQALAARLTPGQRAAEHAKGKAAAARALLLQLRIATPAAARKRVSKSAA